MAILEKLEIHAGLDLFHNTPGAILVDVRNESEYAEGHIPGSHNFPLSRFLKEAQEEFPELTQPIFVYCQSGARSARAAKLLSVMGYETVRDLGGIASYRGPKE